MTVLETLVLFLAIIQTASSASPGQVPEEHDGQKCSPKNYPFVVQVEYTGINFKCLGTLIQPDVVLTGADCVNQIHTASTTVVKAGLFEPKPVIRKVLNGTVCENYTDPNKPANNIGLLWLDKPFLNATVPKLAHLPIVDFARKTCHSVKLVGIGKDSYNCLEMFIFSCREENANISEIFKGKVFCGTSKVSNKVQEKDWGSPVMCRGVVIGLAVIQEKIVESGLVFLRVAGFLSFLQKYVKLEYEVEDEPTELPEADDGTVSAVNGTTSIIINGTKVTILPKGLGHNVTSVQPWYDKATFSWSLVQVPILIILVLLVLFVK